MAAQANGHEQDIEDKVANEGEVKADGTENQIGGTEEQIEEQVAGEFIPNERYQIPFQ
jgi:hypothetical protein